MSIFTILKDSHIVNESDYVPNAGLPDNYDLESTYNIAIYG